MRRDLLGRVFAAVVLVSAVGQSAQALTVVPDTVVRADFDPIAPYDLMTLQVGFSDSLEPVDGYRLSVYSSSHALLHQVTIHSMWYTPYNTVVDRHPTVGAPDPFYVVLDQVVGSFALFQFSFHPWVNSIGYWDFASSFNVREPDFSVSAAEAVSDSGGTLALALMALGFGAVARFRHPTRLRLRTQASDRP